MLASLNCGNTVRTVATLSSSLSRISFTLAGCGKFPPLGTCTAFCCASRATPPGVVARCKASCPAVIDFSCGFQLNLSSGKRSRNLRVTGACVSNSANIFSASDIVDLLSYLDSDNSMLDCSGSLPRLPGLGPLSRAGQYVLPSPQHPFFVLCRNEPQRGVPQGDQRPVLLLAQP